MDDGVEDAPTIWVIPDDDAVVDLCTQIPELGALAPQERSLCSLKDLPQLPLATHGGSSSSTDAVSQPSSRPIYLMF